MPAKPSGHLAGRRPSHKMADILAAALRDGGQFETCEWSISGASAARAAVYAMAADARGWMTKVRNTADGELYQVTDAGRAAWQRYDDWMNGRTS